MLKGFAAVAAVCALGASAHAGPVVVDFEGLANGTWVEGATFAAGTPVQFVATSSTKTLRIFDTTVGGPNQFPGAPDPDLLVNSGNALILNVSSPTATPNDSASGGTIRFEFASAVHLVSIDVIDFDTGTSGSWFRLTDADGNRRTLTFKNNYTKDPANAGVSAWEGIDTVDFSLVKQWGVGGGWIDAVDTGAFDLERVVLAEFRLKGSGALDNLTAQVVPLPGAGMLGLAGLAALATRRRRRA